MIRIVDILWISEFIAILTGEGLLLMIGAEMIRKAIEKRKERKRGKRDDNSGSD